MKKNIKIKENELVMTVPKIDKISIVIDIPELPFATAISQNVWDELKDTESGWVQPYSNGSYNTAAKIFCPDENGEVDTKEPHMLLQIRTKGKYKPHIRVEYNPAKIPQKLYEHLECSFNCITGQSFFETLSHGRVTRLDVCTDIWGINPEDFMLKVKYARHSQNVFGQSGDLETVLFGKSKGTQYAVYKKALEEYGDDGEADIMRIEARLRKSMPIQQLPFIENPFSRVELYNLKPTNLPKLHPSHWTAFVDSVRFRGSVSTALKKQSPDARSKLKYCLSKNTFEGWKPDNLWGQRWLNALEQCHLLKFPIAMPLTFKNATGEDIDDLLDKK
ncbi:MAG: hypothetical protein IT559_04415 [Alphaproteobacteria bacterium]|nr:hypothetical protein [Alphaproteobacteria bacterium]